MPTTDLQYDHNVTVHGNMAFALIALANNMGAIAVALDKLGMNDLSPEGPPGAVEKLALDVVQGLGTLATAIDGHGER